MAKKAHTNEKRAGTGAGGNRSSGVTRSRSRKKHAYGRLSLSRYIQSINSQFNKDGGISSKAVQIIEDFTNQVFSALCRETRTICNKERIQTCDIEHVDAAAHIVLGFNLGKRASKWIDTAVNKYTGSEVVP